MKTDKEIIEILSAEIYGLRNELYSERIEEIVNVAKILIETLKCISVIFNNFDVTNARADNCDRMNVLSKPFSFDKNNIDYSPVMPTLIFNLYKNGVSYEARIRLDIYLSLRIRIKPVGGIGNTQTITLCRGLTEKKVSDALIEIKERLR